MQIDHKIQLAWNLIELLKIFLLKNGERQLKKKQLKNDPLNIAQSFDLIRNILIETHKQQPTTHILQVSIATDVEFQYFVSNIHVKCITK